MSLVSDPVSSYSCWLTQQFLALTQILFLECVLVHNLFRLIPGFGSYLLHCFRPNFLLVASLVHVACIFQYLNLVVGRESINYECLSFHYFSILKKHHFQWLLTSIFFNFSKLPQSHKLRFMVKQTLILKLGFLWNILVRVDQIGLTGKINKISVA